MEGKFIEADEHLRTGQIYAAISKSVQRPAETYGSINKLTSYLVVIGYAVVNLLMHIDFFAGRNIFAIPRRARRTDHPQRMALLA